MPKATTQTSTKAATKAANAKTSKTVKEDKPKRPPTAYNVFMKDKLTSFKANNPEMSHKDAFKAVAALWKDAPENPNRGQDSRPKTTKKSMSEDKENATSKSRPRTNTKAPQKQGKVVEKVMEQSEEEDAGDVGSDE